jgi:hypothetical protein
MRAAITSKVRLSENEMKTYNDRLEVLGNTLAEIPVEVK